MDLRTPPSSTSPVRLRGSSPSVEINNAGIERHIEEISFDASWMARAIGQLGPNLAFN
jgi:hypothetical protein